MGRLSFRRLYEETNCITPIECIEVLLGYAGKVTPQNYEEIIQYCGTKKRDNIEIIPCGEMERLIGFLRREINKSKMRMSTSIDVKDYERIMVFNNREDFEEAVKENECLIPLIKEQFPQVLIAGWK